MRDNVLTLKEISNKVYDILTESGYAPNRQDGDPYGIECTVNGIRFLFYTIEEELFGYSAEFELQSELSNEQKEELAQAYLNVETDDVSFENFHVEGAFACLSSAFYPDMYDDDMIALAIKTLEQKGGIAEMLKAKQIAK